SQSHAVQKLRRSYKTTETVSEEGRLKQNSLTFCHASQKFQDASQKYLNCVRPITRELQDMEDYKQAYSSVLPVLKLNLEKNSNLVMLSTRYHLKKQSSLVILGKRTKGNGAAFKLNEKSNAI
uniref:Uncharacterized protein n=1 Tax=Romanomermis culicivorax TaxID=13658 RepID=A0A915IPU3_ROMCU